MPVTTQPSSIFGAGDPFTLFRAWLTEAGENEINDPNAIALATVDAAGMPNVRVVLLKEIEDAAFVFYTNYDSTKGRELAATGKAAFVIHWKSLRRQVRVRGTVSREEGDKADAYYASRALDSRLGAWASRQSQPLADRESLARSVEAARTRFGENPPRPHFWGGFRLVPQEIEFWADGPSRLHDREVWRKSDLDSRWYAKRLSP